MNKIMVSAGASGCWGMKQSDAIGVSYGDSIVSGDDDDDFHVGTVVVVIIMAGAIILYGVGKWW